MNASHQNPISDSNKEVGTSSTAEDGRAASIHGTSRHLHGPRLVMVTCLNATMLFLVQTEIFIVTTSLVAIAEELGGFDTASWVLASYFLGYVSTCFLPGAPWHGKDLLWRSSQS